MKLIELAVYFRALNIYAHQAHNITKGQSFFQDHGFFGDLYAYADGEYDNLVERYIGLEGKDPDLLQIMEDVQACLKIAKGDHFKVCLELIGHILDNIKKASSGASIGTANLLAGQADALEVWTYKIQQRMKK